MRYSKSKATPKEELAVKGFMRLWTELQEKDKRSSTLGDEDMEHKEMALATRGDRKKSVSQQWEAVSENEEGKKVQQRTIVNNHLEPALNNTAVEHATEAYSLITKDYILSMMQDLPKKVEKPLFKKCLAHAGIAYYIQFNKESGEKAHENGQEFMNDTEIKEQKEILEMLKNMNKNV